MPLLWLWAVPGHPAHGLIVLIFLPLGEEKREVGKLVKELGALPGAC